MTLEKFEYVLALAEEKSLTKAARRLYISQPGLTAYINKLEQHLGIKLFDRSVSPIRVTEAGIVYITKMKQIQKEETFLRMQLHDMASLKRIFRIGIGMTRGIHWLPILLPKFYEMHPEIEVQIHEGGQEELENGVSNGSYDIAFGVLNTGYPGVTYEVIRKEPVYCVIPRSFSAAKKFSETEATIENPALITKEELQGLRFIMPNPDNGFSQFMKELMSNYEIDMGEVLNVSILETGYLLAGEGVGITFINAEDFHCLYPHLDKKLAFCTLEKPMIKRLSAVGYRKGTQNADLIKDMMQIVQEVLLPKLEFSKKSLEDEE